METNKISPTKRQKNVDFASFLPAKQQNKKQKMPYRLVTKKGYYKHMGLYVHYFDSLIN